MRIGLFGGSFNPVHYGHLNIARRAIADLSLDRLIVIPAAVSPFKADPDQQKTACANVLYEERIERVRATFAALPQASVDLREIERGGISYAIDTVRALRAEHAANDTFFFIIGQDSVAGLPRWKAIDELKQLVTFVPYPRTAESSTEIRALFDANGVVVNPDAKLAATVRQGVLRKNGFCPCRLPKIPEFFCPCDEFKSQLSDPAFHGLCHCRLYLKP